VPTAADVIAISRRIVTDLRLEFEPQHSVIGIGVAVPGLVSSLDGHVRLAPHLGWVDEPIAELLSAATGLPVAAANDAHLGARAESIFGTGRGVADFVYLNGGASGIGGGVISGGQAIDGSSGFAGEFGHTFVVSDGALCHCGAHGCLETEVGRAALLSAVGLSAADSDELETVLVSSQSPEVAREVRRQLGFLSIALRNAINVFNPEVVVLGGFLGALHAAASDVLDDLVAGETLAGSRDGVRIERAQLGRLRLTIGAAELAFSGLLADPARVGAAAESVHTPARTTASG
jgi:predicted NBD/HSP70 family sugar kinase